jgi:hypothetical protein
MVITAEMFEDGSRDVATTPPMEWPMTMMEVPLGYRESM